MIATILGEWKALFKKVVGIREESKGAEEMKMDEIVDVIKRYRGIAEEEEDVEAAVGVERPAFDVFMCVITTLNTVVIGLEIDIDGDAESRGIVWVVFEVFFVIAFGMEVILKVRLHGKRWIIDSAMNFVSTLIAVVALFDLCLFYPLRVTGIIRINGILRMITLLRIVGLFRLVRVVQFYRSLDELRLTLQGLLQSIQSIVWVCFCVVVLLYTMSLVTTTVVGHNDSIYVPYRKMSGGWDYQEYFGNVPRSMFTLLQVMTLDTWSSRVVRHVVSNQPVMTLFFFAFLMLSTFGVLNVVVGVIVERVLEISAQNERRIQLRAQRDRKDEKQLFKEVFRIAAKGQDKVLTIDQFVDACQEKRFIEKLKVLGVAADEALPIFTDLHSPTGYRAVALDEFIKGTARLKGIAMSKDLFAIQVQVDSLSDALDELFEEITNSEKLMTTMDEVSLRIKRRFSRAVQGTRQKIAHQKGGSEPVVPQKRPRIGLEENLDLSIGNRPALPNFPNLLA